MIQFHYPRFCLIVILFIFVTAFVQPVASAKTGKELEAIDYCVSRAKKTSNMPEDHLFLLPEEATVKQDILKNYRIHHQFKFKNSPHVKPKNSGDTTLKSPKTLTGLLYCEVEPDGNTYTIKSLKMDYTLFREFKKSLENRNFEEAENNLEKIRRYFPKSNYLTKAEDYLVNRFTPPVKTQNPRIKTKAFRGIYFEMSKDLVKFVLKADSEFEHTNLYERHEVDIGGKPFFLNFEFYKNKLVRVYFVSSGFSATYFSTKIRNNQKLLKEVIKRRYGNPPWTRELHIYDIEPKQVAWSHIWQPYGITSEKRIKIGIGQDEHKFYAVLMVEYPPLVREEQMKKENKHDEKIRESSDDF